MTASSNLESHFYPIRSRQALVLRLFQVATSRPQENSFFGKNVLTPCVQIQTLVLCDGSGSAASITLLCANRDR
jgi:hypothetical protein